ncbi:E3 ubiquitin-protein ligase AMFR [Frankliniella fusca]|uniref:E3 ubiquitin-protein ligase AMFR n=1 Tax=Frankliniella fusca TaxID=407009 RepID=A0AAE1H0L8_9NEOP|nr:E3 ubiquitin-protein ligase AMFR [Frankliniella fusca]
MPVILVDRLPLPSLKTYTVISVALLSCSVYYAVQVTSEANWKTNATTLHEEVAQAASGKVQEHAFTHVQQIIEPETAQTQIPPLLKSKPTLSVHIAEVITYMVQEPLCIWVSNV